MNIIVTNLPIASPAYGPTYRTHHLAEEWSKAGHRVTVVGSSFSHLLSEPVRFKGALQEESCHQVRYVHLKTPSYKGSGVRRVINIISGLSRLKRHTHRILEGHKPDVIMSASAYQLDNFWARSTSRKFDCSFVRETRDLWPMTLIELGGLPWWHPFTLWVQKGEDCAYRWADLVSTTLADSHEYMEGRGLRTDRWVYLPQCPPPPFPESPHMKLPRAHCEALAQARLRNSFLVCFAGSLVPATDFSTLIQAAQLLSHDSVSILLVGQGPSEKLLRGLIAATNVKNVTMLPQVSKELVPCILAKCHAGIQLFRKHRLYKYGISPNKVLEYMQHGLPVVLSCATSRTPVADSQGGIVVAPERPDLVADAVRTLKSMPVEERWEMGKRASEHVNLHHNIKTVANCYLGLFDEIRDRRRIRR